MTLEGSAFLALWNDRSPVGEDYDVWHSREHVPERFSVPGISLADRNTNGRGLLPRYFTLYTLTDMAVLTNDAYVHVLHIPTPWSQSMRPDFSRFFRLPCKVEVSTGGGEWCVACAVSQEPDARDVRRLIDDLVGLAPITGVHHGRTDLEASAVPCSMPLEEHSVPNGVLIVEGFKDESLTDTVSALLDDYADRIKIEKLITYNLAFALNANSIANIHPYRRPLTDAESRSD